MTLAELPYERMTVGQRVLWFSMCGCNAEEISEWLQIPCKEIVAMLVREDFRYDPMKRPV